MWVCLRRPTLCVVVFNCLPISPIKEPRALRSQPHMAQRNPNVLCSPCEDVIASTLSALKDMIWRIACILIRGSPRWGDQLSLFATDCPNFCNEKISSQTLHPGLDLFSVLKICSSKLKCEMVACTWHCGPLLWQFALTLTILWFYWKATVLTFVLCSNPRVFRLYLTEF